MIRNIKLIVLGTCCLFLIPMLSCFAQDNNVHHFSEALDWLQQRGAEQIRDCRRLMDNGVAAYPPQVGIGYNAFWLRDYVYILEGCAAEIPEKDLRDAVQLFLNAQTKDGVCVDCVKYDGTPIYKPGYGSMGTNPVADGSQFTVAVVYLTWKQLHDNSLLDTKTLDKLRLAMNAVPKNPQTGLVWINPQVDWDRCPYGFHDTVRKKGDVLFESLLYFEAAQRLAEMFEAAKRPDDAEHFRKEADSVSNRINEIFWDENLSLYRAATIQCREGDIWGNAFAVWLNIAPPERTKQIAQYFLKHYNGLVFEGQIRMLPPNVYWEAGCERDVYQNGAYWGTATGWFAWTLHHVDPKKAEQTIVDLVNGYRRTNCPEWVFGQTIRLPKYMSSVTLPIAPLRQIITINTQQDK